MTGRWQRFEWRGRPARAWIPDRLSERSFDFDERTIRATEQATAALRLTDRSLPADFEPLARLLLRTEGIASSSIEGVRAPIVDVAVSEVASSSSNAGWIADNLSAVAEAMSTTGDLSTESLHQWHQRLMVHSPLDPSMVGAFRAAPSWIGGTSPQDAAFVPPPAAAVPGLVDDLIAWANADHLDPVTQAALVHAQFETIHPYADGNGRLGRILIGWVLLRRGVVGRLPPPISVLIARDPGGYISGLHLFREGPSDHYVRWFADVVAASARQSDEMVERISRTLRRWEQDLDDLRSDAAALRLIRQLPQAPVVTAPQVAVLLETSERSARTALELLRQRGMVELVTPAQRDTRRGRPPSHYAATALLDATSEWAR